MYNLMPTGRDAGRSRGFRRSAAAERVDVAVGVLEPSRLEAAGHVQVAEARHPWQIVIVLERHALCLQLLHDLLGEQNGAFALPLHERLCHQDAQD